MSGYEYGNTRLRVMKSRLLRAEEIEAMVDSGTVNAMITALTKTSYRRSVESALAHASGMACIDDALRIDRVAQLRRIRSFYHSEPDDLAAQVFRYFDIQNIKAILRGSARHIPPAEMLLALVPVGELDESLLGELALAADPREVIDLMISMQLPFSTPLIKLRGDFPGASVHHMELALDQWYASEAMRLAKASGQYGSLFLTMLQMDADITNMLSALRFAQSPGERKYLRDWFPKDDLALLFVGPGKVPISLLVQAGMQDTVDAAMQLLSETRYAEPLKSGLAAYENTALLSAFEKQLRLYRLKVSAAMIVKDPLGIGVLIGYLDLKRNEISNLRWIAQGISMQLSKAKIRAELEF